MLSYFMHPWLQTIVYILYLETAEILIVNAVCRIYLISNFMYVILDQRFPTCGAFEIARRCVG